jgi:hypothetical protein
MRCQPLLFLSLLTIILLSPLVAQADRTTDIIRKNNADLDRYQNSQNGRSTQEDRKLIITEYKGRDEYFSASSNQKVHHEVIKIKIAGKNATVVVRITAIAQYSTSVGMAEEIWHRNNNNQWKYVSGRVLPDSTTTRSQVNSTGQVSSRHNLVQAQSLADQAIRGCHNEKKLDECDKLQQIESTLSNWCKEGDQNACGIWSSVMSSEQTASFNEMNKN